MMKIPERSELPEIRSLFGSDQVDHDPIPPNYATLRDFIQIIGQRFFSKVWTGEECETTLLVWDNVYLSSNYEVQAHEEYQRELFKLQLLATFGKIDSHQLEIYDGKVKIDPCFIQGDLATPAPFEVEKLNNRLSGTFKHCHKIKSRRDKAVINTLIPALWGGDLVAHYVGLDGSIQAIENKVWFKESDWAPMIVEPVVKLLPNPRDRLATRAKTSSILLNKPAADAWLAASAKQKRGRPAEKRAACIAVITELYPNGKKPNGETWEAIRYEIQERCAVGEISVDTVQKAFEKVASKSLPGSSS